MKIVNGVLVSDSGELFLAGGAHSPFCIDGRSGRVEEDDIRRFWDNIQARVSYSKEKRIKYRHFVFPDKHLAYADKLTFRVDSKFSQYLSQVSVPHESASSAVSDLLRPIRDLGDGSFFCTDTHMTEITCLKLATHILREIGVSSRFSRQEFSPVTRTTQFTGDLGSKLSPEKSEQKTVLERTWPVVTQSNRISGNDGLIDIHVNKEAPNSLRLAVFGDSFFRHISAFFSVDIEETVFMRSRFFHYEMVDMIRPDIVLSGNVDRYLDFVQRDEERPHFLLYPALYGKTSDPTPAFYQALNDLLMNKYFAKSDH